MKKRWRALTSVAALGALLFLPQFQSPAAANEVETKCHYDGPLTVNPDSQTMNCLLTETALAYDVPPEIVKAIAERESGGWKHFDENGEAIVTEDNGIGIMQITNQSGYDEEKLKTDLLHNIEAGVQILDQMFMRSDLPKINNGDRDVLENWYFAVMAYNGIKPVNSPIVKATGERNLEAYQEQVYQNIRKYGLVDTTQLPFASEDFRYDPESTKNIEFLVDRYKFNVPHTKTKHAFTAGQKVETTTEVRMRASATTDSNHTTLAAGEVLTITGPFAYDEVSSKQNHFVWYPVKRSDGSTGFVASSYLKLRFKDVPAGHYAEEEISYLVDRGILHGVGGDRFGLGDGLTRWQAVLLLTRAQNVSLENRPDPGFSDVPKTYPYYPEIAAAVDEGLFQGVDEQNFNPEATLTRQEMAVVLQRIYQFPEAKGAHPFTDLTADWSADEIARLYDAGITGGVTATTFGPTDTVTREQFAVFMVRSIEEGYRLR